MRWRRGACVPVFLAALGVTAPVPPVCGPAAAQALESTVAPGPAARAARRERLFGFLARADSSAAGLAMEMEIWHFWLQAPRPEDAELMNEALQRRRVYDLAGAEALLDRLVAQAPDWAEAWNQRATVRFERDDEEGSLADIERALALEPKHFGAMAGQAIILMRTGRMRVAQAILRRAVAIHPYLVERAMLLPSPDGADPRDPGQPL